MTTADLVRMAWGDIRPDDAFLTRLVIDLRRHEVAGDLIGDGHRRRWIVAGALASVAGVGLAAYEMHRIRRRKAVA